MLSVNTAITISTVANNNITFPIRLYASTFTNSTLLWVKKYMKYTNPSHIKISKIFDPKPLLTAISVFHFLATIIEENISGREVPTAKIVSQIITLGIPTPSAKLTAEFTMR
ncbi:hypothetical protein KKG31_01140 [Patescibacteria group bacterium]|nr:hypothetical protein [Patescibacteria group bacterium]MBU1757784.1 hypothetical protein [Patescibacteria group bacterium]